MFLIFKGTWLDSDGSELTYTNWADSEPNDFKGQDYASIYHQNGKWGDVKGKERGVVVCYQPWDKGRPNLNLKFVTQIAVTSLESTQQCTAQSQPPKNKQIDTSTNAEVPQKQKNLIKFDLMHEVEALFKQKGKA